MKQLAILLFAALLAAAVISPETSIARRVRVLSYPKTIAAGQLGFITFENPNPEISKSQSKCTAERLIAWVASDIPILRIQQNGKEVWMSLGSYQTMGDTCIASFMAPVTLEPGPALLFLVNNHDASVPYPFTAVKDYDVSLKSVEGAGIKPLGQFRLVGLGFVPTTVVNTKNAIEELDHNIGYSTMTKADQWINLNRRIANDWDRLKEGNFLTIEQSGKHWRGFVEQCGITATGLALDFIAPPDIRPGAATLVLTLRENGKEVAKSAPLTVTIQ